MDTIQNGDRQHPTNKTEASKRVDLSCAFHGVLEARPEQEKQLIYKHNRQILVEKFHRRWGGYDSSISEWLWQHLNVLVSKAVMCV